MRATPISEHNGQLIKLCSKCGAAKPLDDFYRNPKGHQGRSHACKACHRQAVLTRYHANPEPHRARMADWNASHVEQRRANDRAYRARNPGRAAENLKAWRRANPDYGRAWSHVRRARNAGLEAEMVSITELGLAADWRCGICHEPVDPSLVYPHPQSKSIDHILPLSQHGPTVRADLQIAHLRCNASRKAQPLSAVRSN